MRLIACANCHAQYDVAEVVADSFPCRCGETLENRPREAVDAEVKRCGSCGALVSAEIDSCAYCGSGIVRDTRNLSLICPECYARCTDDARFCTACGVGFHPEPLHLDGRELPCPVCVKLMPARQVGGIGLNECLECRGLWIPGAGFDRLVSHALESRRDADSVVSAKLPSRVNGANPAKQLVEYRKCPECDAFMIRRNYRKRSGIIIDGCKSCGTWLDADELEAIAGFIQQASLAEPAATRKVRQTAESSAEAEFAGVAGKIRARADAGLEGGVPNVGVSLVELLLDLFD